MVTWSPIHPLVPTQYLSPDDIKLSQVVCKLMEGCDVMHAGVQ